MIRRPPDLTPDLHRDATHAASGDELALDRLFHALVIEGPAWGSAWAATNHVPTATKALAHGISETLQVLDNGLTVRDVELEVLQTTRAAGLTAAEQRPILAPDFGRHARSGGTPLVSAGAADVLAAEVLARLPEPMRSVLWLVEGTGASAARAAHLLGQSVKSTETLVRQGRRQFRETYIAEASRGLPADSEPCRDVRTEVPDYLGRQLTAGDIASVESHLDSCDDCRFLVQRLDSLGPVLRAALPPLPASARQQVSAAWQHLAPRAARREDRREPGAWWLEHSKPPALVVAGVAAAVLLLGGVIWANVDRPVEVRQASQSTVAPSVDSSALTAPSTTGETTPSTITTELPETTTTTPSTTESTTTTTTTAAPTTAPPAPAPDRSITRRQAATSPLVRPAAPPPPPPPPTTPPPPPPTIPPGYGLIDLPPPPRS